MKATKLAVVIAALALTVSGWAQNAPNTHSGEFVKTNTGGFTMTVDGKNEHPHTVTDQTRYTLNGKVASIKDFKQGDRINVTMSGKVVTAVDATRPNP